jgi:hypothetical protein
LRLPLYHINHHPAGVQSYPATDIGSLLRVLVYINNFAEEPHSFAKTAKLWVKLQHVKMVKEMPHTE